MQPLYPMDTTSSWQYSMSGIGWVRAGGGAYDRVTMAGSAGMPNSPGLADLLRSGEWGYAGGGNNDGELELSVSPNQLQMVTIIVGDNAPRDNTNVYVGTPSAPFGTLLNPSLTTFNTMNSSYQFVSYSGVIDPGSNSTICLSFETLAGSVSRFWTIAGFDVRPISSVAPLALTRTGSSDGAPPNTPTLPADGSSVDTYSGSGAAPFAELTVNPQFGTPLDGSGVATDIDPAVKGFQVQADARGNFGFAIKRPTGVTSSILTVTDVTGASGTGQVGPTGSGPFAASGGPYTLPAVFTQSYLPLSVQRFDFNLGNSPNLNGFIGVLPTTLFNATAGYGWKTTVSGYDRGTGTGASPTALFEDGAWGSGSRTFEVRVPSGADRDVRVYIGDPYAARAESVSVEGNPVAVADDPVVARYGFVTAHGFDANNDGILDITINGGVWVASGIDIANTGSLPAPATIVPPTIPATGMRLEFAANPISGFMPVSSALYAPNEAYGWSSPVNYAVRAASMFGTISTLTAAEKQFYGSIASGSAPTTFQMAVPITPPSQSSDTYLVRVYLADPYATWQNIALRTESMTSSITANSSVNPPKFMDVSVQDLNRDGFISLTISGGTWVINGLDAVKAPNNLPAAP